MGARKQEVSVLRLLTLEIPLWQHHNSPGCHGKAFAVLFGVTADLRMRWYVIIFVDNRFLDFAVTAYCHAI